jgi:signal transduction histidine kinase
MAVTLDRMLAGLMIAQWMFAIVFAYFFSPLAWAGKQSVVHAHLFAAVVVGGVITSLPVLMARIAPGEQMTRYIVATGQVLWSALLIHLMGGRIETHFHVFASLAILAFYRDFKVLIPATVVVAADHFIRGMYWPESVYGVLNPEWWRFLEHAGWVIFLDGFLIYQCLNTYRELQSHCNQQIELEDATTSSARLEKLAAVGQLAASVGHELRNPLGAIRNAHTFLEKKLDPATTDPKVMKFLVVMKREIDASSKIISNLLDFSRGRDPVLSACPLRPLVAETLGIVPPRSGIVLKNEVSEDLPVPDLDKDQFRQVVSNLVQNASEAFEDGNEGEVVVQATGGGSQPWVITVRDDGPGMSDDVARQIFQPLYSTKVKGTGLGLAVVAGIVERHGGKLTVDTALGSGTTFTIEIPRAKQEAA